MRHFLELAMARIPTTNYAIYGSYRFPTSNIPFKNGLSNYSLRVGRPCPVLVPDGQFTCSLLVASVTHPPPRQRVEFSQEDKENLAKYLACRVPVPAQGGLQGKILYKELVKLHQVDPKEYEWVKRHSWQSWRDQYKHNQAYYHALIADFVSQSPNHDRHRYFRTRELNRGVKRSHSDDEEDVEDNNSGHIPTRNWRGKRAAREEERRQESIARRQEDEEDSEEDDAS